MLVDQGLRFRPLDVGRADPGHGIGISLSRESGVVRKPPRRPVATMDADGDGPSDERDGGTVTGKTEAAARAVDVWKSYGTGEAAVTALAGVSVDFERGRFTAIMGPSGSGKSTLMHCLAGLDTIDRGEVHIGATKVNGLRDKGLTDLRRTKVGFIFQQFNLLPTLTAEENITLPLTIGGRKVDRAWFDTVVDTVGLRDRLTHRPTQLSGGQQQRVACARALVARPEVVFADEPTGNLDSRSGAEVLGFLQRSAREFGQTVVMVTHDPNAASYADRVIFLADGRIVRELHHPTADAVLETMKHLDGGELVVA
jgi:putative ABC transport system ATP-binding protein